MWRTLVASSLLIAAAVVTAVVAAPEAAARSYRVGTECTYFPFNYRDGSGALVGYDVDVVREIDRRIAAEFEFVCQDWNGMIPAILAHNFTLIAASMSVTEKRKELIDFSVPYRAAIGRFIAAKGSGLTLFSEDRSLDPAAFEGLRVGLQRATVYDNWFSATIPAAAVTRYDKRATLYRGLQSGEIDVIVLDPMKAYLEFLSTVEGAVYEMVGRRIAEPEYFGVGAAIGIRKGHQDLREAIDAAIAEMAEDGTLETLSRRYFPFAIHPRD